MKKIFVVLFVVLFVCCFLVSCGTGGDSVKYCPYCKSSVSELEDGIYQCSNVDKCGRIFGAKEIIIHSGL